MNKQRVKISDVGRIQYAKAWDIQTEIQQGLVRNKRANSGSKDYSAEHQFLICEHNPVYTLGKSGDEANLLLNQEEIIKNGVEFFKVNRGGDITYHGPGQIVGYPIFDLDLFFTDIHKYVRYIEEAVILTLAEYNIEATRYPQYTGVWLAPTLQRPFWRKICAIGVHLSRWVTMHGFALNVRTDLNYFGGIIPCGIADPEKTVCSIESELGKEVDYEEVKLKLIRHFAELFDFDYELVKYGTEEYLIHKRVK